MTTSRKNISKTKKETIEREQPYRRRTVPETVCNDDEITVMKEIHKGLWDQGWKLKSISKRKFGWQFYIIPRQTYEEQCAKKLKSRDTCKEYKTDAS